MRTAIMVVTVGAVVASVAVGAAIEGQPSPAVAQDGKGRVVALETRVAGLETELATLTSRVDALEGGTSGAADGAQGIAMTPAAVASEPIVFTGTGDTITESFAVMPGTLRFSAVHEGTGNFAVWIYGPQGSMDLPFNEIGYYEGQHVVSVSRTGDFGIGIYEGAAFLEVTADGPWRIEVSQ